MNSEKYLVVISGPSGCGKDTLFREMKKMRPQLELSVSCTTREMREGECEGVDYYYISREEFSHRIDSGRMLEYTEYSGNLYGTPMDEIEARMNSARTVVLVIEVCGGAAVKRIYPGALLMFVAPPSMRELKRRLVARSTESMREVRRRLRIARRELAQRRHYDYVVINDDVHTCAVQMLDIIDNWQKEK